MMDADQTLLRGRLALEAAEASIAELLELDRDAGLSVLREDVRTACERLEAVQLDRALKRARDRASA